MWCEQKDGLPGYGRTQGTCPVGYMCYGDGLCSRDCRDLDYDYGDDAQDFDRKTDAQGHHCTWYEINDANCGIYDDEDFKAKDLCCACNGLETFDPNAVKPTSCIDTDNGATDIAEFSCHYYERHWCGKKDDHDFDSQQMCCICGGGEPNGLPSTPGATTPRQTTAAPTTPPQGYNYTIVNSDQLCHDVNLEPIGSLTECKNAAINLKESNPKIVFEEEEDTEDWPKGCYAYESTDIYWNKHSTGDSNHYGHPVCKAGKDCRTGDGESGREVYLGEYTDQECIDAVKKNHPKANGATSSKPCNDKCSCYAEFEMTGWLVGSTGWQSCMWTIDGCVDSANGKTDRDGDGCTYYDANLEECGYYDDDDFKANDLCCSCGGGKV